MPTPIEIQKKVSTISRHQLFLGSLICTIGAIFYCYEFILRIIPGALQSELSAAFGGISASTFGQLSAFYYFAYSPMQLPVGMLMDRFGPRRLLSFACLCCALGSLMFMYSASLWVVGFGRFLVGFGSSFAFVGVLSLAVNWLPQQYFSLVAGLISLLGMMGLVYGEMKITHFASTVGLDSVLFSMVIFGAILSLLIILIVRDGPVKHEGQRHPLPEFFRLVGQVLLSPQVWLIGFVGACMYTSLSVFGELWGKTYLEQAHHLTKLQAAETVSCLFLGWGIGAPIVGYLSDKSRHRVLPIIISAVVCLICISIVLYCPGLSYSSLKLLMFFYGLFSGAEIIVFIMAKENSQVKLAGTVFAATNMIVTLGGVIFQPLVGKLLDSMGDSTIIHGEHVYSVMDYQLALSILPLSLLVVMIAAFFLKDHQMIKSY